MNLTVQSSAGDVTHMQCAGEITQNDLWQCDNPLEPLLGPAGFAGKVLVNLEKTHYIDSAGISWFLGCHKQFKESGGTLVLHSIPPMVNQVFQLLQMHKVLHLAKDEETALAFAKGASHE